MILKSFYALVILVSFSLNSWAQGYWQQQAQYTMDVKLNVENHQFSGTQKLVYQNNSPDTLHQVFYHLYFNAFQPGSMMDVRTRNLPDPDGRIGNRIVQLQPEEEGYLKVGQLKQDGKKTTWAINRTILKVALAKPLLPGKSTTLDMTFDGQVPIQIRRSGRDNKEGVAYSMAQWYPKMAEYDGEGWHTNEYIAREFYGVWGDFDVTLTLDKTYTVAATGVIQNPQEVGHGYEQEGSEVVPTKGDQLTWHFKAENVHDFVWAADPDYVHDTYETDFGLTLHFFYQNDSLTPVENWKRLGEFIGPAFQYMNEHFGTYPYPVYSIIQGGDGGMEYPMATLITGHRNLGSLVGVSVHELIHSWYQMILGTNESKYAWMDEGFTTYASALVMRHLFPSDKPPHGGSYYSYFNIVRSGLEEPMSTHADHFQTNQAYGVSSYSKGSVFLAQLGYVVGEEVLAKSMLRYFDQWKFKHPTPNDFKRIVEKESGLDLDWYFEQWIQTTNTIDYGLRSLVASGDSIYLSLERIGEMMMPIELLVTYTDGKQECYYLPLHRMQGSKKSESKDLKWVEVGVWPWTHPQYTLGLGIKASEIRSIEIDPSQRMADVDRSNNLWEMKRLKQVGAH